MVVVVTTEKNRKFSWMIFYKTPHKDNLSINDNLVTHFWRQYKTLWKSEPLIMIERSFDVVVSIYLYTVESYQDRIIRRLWQDLWKESQIIFLLGIQN